MQSRQDLTYALMRLGMQVLIRELETIAPHLHDALEQIRTDEVLLQALCDAEREEAHERPN